MPLTPAQESEIAKILGLGLTSQNVERIMRREAREIADTQIKDIRASYQVQIDAKRKEIETLQQRCDAECSVIESQKPAL